MRKLIVQMTQDPEVLKAVNEALAKRNGYCPCAVFPENATEEEKQKYKCMCEDFRLQNEQGPCHCGKFAKVLVDFPEKKQ